MSKVPVRYTAKCKSCNAVTSTAVDHAAGNFGAMFVDRKGECGVIGDYAIRCSSCGKARRAFGVFGKFSSKHKCGAKCLASKGPTCECSCGGKNHGASYSAA